MGLLSLKKLISRHKWYVLTVFLIAGSVYGTRFSSVVTDILDVDNIRVDGNTISSTDTNGPIIFAPNGTGVLRWSSSDVNLTQWGYLSALDQDLSSTDTPLFGGLKVGTGSLTSPNIFEVATTTGTSSPCPPMNEAQRDLISSPVAGSCVFNTDTGRLNSHDGSDWSEVGSGTGSGILNYFPNGDFESGIDFAQTFDESPYVDGEGGSPSVITISAGASFPPVGDSYLGILKDSSDGSAEGVTLTSENVDIFYQNGAMYISFICDCDDADYPSGDYILKVYDGTDVIEITPISGLDSSGGLLNGSNIYVLAAFKSGNTLGDVNVSLHLETDNATSDDHFIRVDNFKMSPTEIKDLVGQFTTDWKTVTCSGTWVTNTTYTCRMRQQGPNNELDIKIDLAGAPTSATLIMDLPSSLEFDSNWTHADIDSRFGQVSFLDSGSSNLVGGTLRYEDSNSFRFMRANPDSVANNLNTNSVDATTPFTFASGDKIFARFSFPVSGQANGNLFSTHEAHVRTTDPSVTLSGDQNITTTTSTKVQFDTIVTNTDPLGTIDTANYRFVAVHSNNHKFGGQVRFNNLNTGDINVELHVNGSALFTTSNTEATAVRTVQIPPVNIYLQKGDYVEIFARSGTDTNYNVDSATANGTPSVFTVNQNFGLTILGLNGVYEDPTSVELTANTDTVSADTEVDVSGSTLSLTAGTWKICFNGTVQLNDQSGSATTMHGNLMITDSSNNVLDGGTAYFGNGVDANDFLRFPTRHCAQTVTITQDTSYKLRLRCSVAAASGLCSVRAASNQTAGLTDPDVESIFYAERKR